MYKILLQIRTQNLIEPVNVAQGKGFAISETAQNIAKPLVIMVIWYLIPTTKTAPRLKF